MKKGLLFIIFLSTIFLPVYALSNITACGTLSTPEYYVLQNNITTTGTCLTVGTNNVAIDCNGYGISYGTGGASSVYGVFADTRTNVSVMNCDIQDGSSGGSTNRAIYYFNTVGGSIVNNTLAANGTSTIETILVRGSETAVDTNIIIANNSVAVQGTGSDVRGIYFFRAMANTVSGNAVTATSSGNNLASILLNIASNNVVHDNQLIVEGSATSPFGIDVQVSINSNFTQNNVTIRGNAGTGAFGITITASSTDSLVEGNTIAVLTGGTTGGGPRGISVSVNSHRTTARNNDITMGATNLEHGIIVSDAEDSVFTGNNVTILSGLTTSIPFHLLNTVSDTYIANNILDSPNRWIVAASTNSNATFYNQTFRTGNGNIRINQFNITGEEDLNSSDLAITHLNAFVNSTNNTFLNTSARITLNGTGFLGHQLLVDHEDNGIFVDCNPPICVEVSDTNGQIVFDVLHFTTFGTAEFIDAVPEFHEWALIILLGIALTGVVIMRRN